MQIIGNPNWNGTTLGCIFAFLDDSKICFYGFDAFSKATSYVKET